ncbi:MAG: hypothetical protein ACREH4_13390 [Vitreimonas sp.]
MQVQPRLSLAEWEAVTTWRPPAALYSKWPAHRPLTDRSPWWRHFTEVSKPPRRMNLSADAFEKHCDEIAAFVRTQPLPWNGEAGARHCIRVRLIMGGWGWHDADSQAHEVVQEALRRCGCAERPTWQQGQPDWAQPGFDPVFHTHCVRCGEKIPDERTGGNKGRGAVKYCSQLCGQSHYGVRAKRYGGKVSRAEYSARQAAQRQRTLEAEIDCPGCGQPFKPGYRLMRRKFCSPACARKHGAKRQPAQLFSCIRCGEQFLSRGAANKYCSVDCYHQSKVLDASRLERTCIVCSTIFSVRTVSKAQACCSRRCAWVYRKRGTHARAAPRPAEAEDDQERERRCA